MSQLQDWRDRNPSRHGRVRSKCAPCTSCSLIACGKGKEWDEETDWLVEEQLIYQNRRKWVSVLERLSKRAGGVENPCGQDSSLLKNAWSKSLIVLTACCFCRTLHSLLHAMEHSRPRDHGDDLGPSGKVSGYCALTTTNCAYKTPLRHHSVVAFFGISA